MKKLKKWLIVWLISGMVPWVAADEPVLRVGIMTDTHIDETEKSLALVHKAFLCFREQKVDLIVHQGDIAEVHCPEGYRLYRQLFNRVFPEDQPMELFVYAGHDTSKTPGWEVAYPIVQREIGARNAPVSKTVIKGYPFLTFPQPIPRQYEEAIAAACREFPGKPVFVLDHAPAYRTIHHSRMWGSIPQRRVLEKFPQVVQLSGHSHNSLRNEAVIWQGAFTAINAGCLQVWAGEPVGKQVAGKPADGVLIMEVYPDRLVIRRRELLTGREYRADSPWIVPLPFDPATAPYNHDRLRASSPAPAFPARAALQVSCDAKNLKVTGPEASPDVMYYQVELQIPGAGGAWRTVFLCHEYSSFYLHEPLPAWSSKINRGVLPESGRVRVMAVPVNFWGRKGTPLTRLVTVPPAGKMQTVWETENVASDCRILQGKRPLAVTADGSFRFDNSSGSWSGAPRLYLPAEAWQAPAGAPLRLTVDMSADLPPEEHVALRLRILKPERSRATVCTPVNDPRPLRYVFEIKKDKADTEYFVMLDAKCAGTIRIERIAVEIPAK